MQLLSGHIAVKLYMHRLLQNRTSSWVPALVIPADAKLIAVNQTNRHTLVVQMNSQKWQAQMHPPQLQEPQDSLRKLTHQKSKTLLGRWK